MPQPQASPIERIASGLQLIEKVYGIKANMATLEKAKADQEAHAAAQTREQGFQQSEDDPNSPIAQSIREKVRATGIRVPDDASVTQMKRLGLIDLMASHQKQAHADQNKNRLPPDKVLAVNEGKQIPGMLGDIEKTIQQNADSFGPVMGKLSSMNPYDTKAQTIDSQMRTAAQAFGRYMEGGVLRKEDEEKYRKMFPVLGETPELAANKLQIVKRLLAEKQNSNVEALRSAGYDVSPFGGQIEKPDAPQVLAGSKPAAKGDPYKANAGGPESFDAEDLQAMEWAKANQQDPRAKEIVNRLRMKGLK
jgi:hypothetical protein